MRRFLVSFIAISAAVVPNPAGAHDAECGGYAPLQTECSTGLHLINGVTHGVTWGASYTGQVATALEWDTGFRSRVCEVFLGSLTGDGCVSYGEFPPPGTVVTHMCYSNLPRNPYIASSGGLLNWGCYIRAHPD